jgi:hypothetical protein
VVASLVVVVPHQREQFLVQVVLVVVVVELMAEA